MDDYKKFEKLQQRTVVILEQSDIVWSKYGSETIEELAERIVAGLLREIEEYRFHNNKN